MFELKYDGFRALAYIEAGQCRLVSRKRNQFKRFQSLCAAIAETIRGAAVLDGEIACLDSDGKSQFYELMRRRLAPTYCAFDILWLNGRDLRSKPLLERKAIVKGLVRPPLLYVDHMERRGVQCGL